MEAETRVLMVYPSLIPSVLLCGKMQMEWLAANGAGISFRSLQRDELTPGINGWPDVVMMVRSDSIMELDLAQQWKRAGKYLIYILDDDLLNVPGYCSSASFYCRKDIKKNILGIMNECECLLTPTDNLRKKYGGTFQQTLHIEEPSSMNLWRKNRVAEPVRIGFAGSVDRAKDIDLLLGETIHSILNRYGDSVSIEFLGAAPQIAKDLNLQCYTYCDSYEEYQNKMKELAWDIALAPMPDTPFHACKHYNKFVEYAGCGIAGVYSDVEPYSFVIRHEENGILCKNTTQAWVEGIARLVEDSALRFSISSRCSQLARDVYSVPASAQKLERELTEILRHRAKSYVPIAVSRNAGMRMFAVRAGVALKKHGLRLPTVALKRMMAKMTRGKRLS